MEIGDLPAYFIQEIKDYSAQAHYERNAFRLSELLGVRIRPGRYTSIIPGPPPTIILEPQLLGLRDSDHVRHELGHVIMWWSGVEKALVEEFGSTEAAKPYIESLCHAAVAFLRAPQNLVDEATRRFGVSASAAAWLREETRMTPYAAMQRLVYDDPAATRAGFVMSGNYVAEVAGCNFRLPFWRYDRVPDPSYVLPDEVSPSLVHIPGTTTAIGICSVLN